MRSPASDMRGMTNPQETLSAQELKANFATRRIVPQQREVARFARDLLRLMGAVIAEHFSEKTIAMISGYAELEPSFAPNGATGAGRPVCSARMRRRRCSPRTWHGRSNLRRPWR